MDPIQGMINDICGPDLFKDILEILSMNLFADSPVLEAVKGLHEVIKPIALLLAFVYFMIAFIDKTTSENFTWEQIFRQMLMLLASVFLINHGFEILEYLFGIGMMVAGDVSEYYTETAQKTVEVEAIIESWKESSGFFGWMPDIFVKGFLIIFLLLPWLISWAMGLVVSIICYSRMIEIYFRATFAPLAVTDFFHSGLQSAGWRYLKNFLAVCLQGAAILVIAIIYSKLMETMSVDETELFKFIGKYLAFYASAIMLMLKSLSLTKEIVGTG